MPEERSRARGERVRKPGPGRPAPRHRAGPAGAAADPGPVPRGSVVAATTGLLGLSSTRRAAVLALVVCALALTVVVPLRNYVAQRQELAAVTAQQQALAAEVDELGREQARLADPAEIAAAGPLPARLRDAGRGALRRAAAVRRAPTARRDPAADGRPGTASCGARSQTDRRGSKQGAERGHGECAVPGTPRRERRAGRRLSAEHAPVDAADEAAVAAQLGRAPRGVLAVAHRCPCGLPAVVQTAPRLPDGTPFPTLYYLTCARLNSRIGGLEADGRMREMTERLDDGPGARRRPTAARTRPTSPSATRSSRSARR